MTFGHVGNLLYLCMMKYTNEYFEEIIVSNIKDGVCSFRSFCSICKKHYRDLICSKTPFLDIHNASFMERLYCVYNGITSLVICQYCGCKCKFNEAHPSYYSTCCSKECNNKLLSSTHEGSHTVSEKRITSFIEKQKRIKKVNDTTIKRLYEYDKYVDYTDNPIIINYLNHRYSDSSSLLETVQRIRFGIETKPLCPTCGKPVTWLGKKSHLYTKYCSDLKCVANNEETKELKKSALIRNWGGAGCYNTDKYRSMMMEKYGVTTHMQRDGVKEKRNHTLIERYGTTTLYKIPGVKDKVKQTCVSKYGTEYPFTLPEVKLKAYRTALENSKTQKSKEEDRIYECLLSLGYKVERWKMTKDFPYNVDFYLPEYDLYVEYQGSQYHNSRAFIGTKEDKRELQELYKKNEDKGGNSQYGMIAYVWSVLDVKKREEAKRIGLKYLEIYSFRDVSDIERQIDMFLRFCGNRELIQYNEDVIRIEYDYYENLRDDTLHANQSIKNSIVKYFQQDTFYKRERESFMYDPITRRKVIQNRMKYLNKKEYELTTNDVLLGYKISGEIYGYSHFNPRWINFVIRKYGVHSVYDACGGWGHHLLGMLSCDRIIYNDIDAHVCKNITRIKETFDITQLVVHNGDASEYTPENVDLFFACPPYYNIEKYAEGGYDSLDDYKTFLNSLFSIWKNNSAKYFCLIIREDFVGLLDMEYVECYDLNITTSHFVKNKKYKEKMYIFEK